MEKTKQPEFLRVVRSMLRLAKARGVRTVTYAAIVVRAVAEVSIAIPALDTPTPMTVKDQVLAWIDGHYSGLSKKARQRIATAAVEVYY